MTLHAHKFPRPVRATAAGAGLTPGVGVGREEARPDIAAFAATLRPDSPLYWPALAASDGCEASLRELNEMLVADGCVPFPVED